MVYTISHFITILRAFLTSSICNATLKNSCQSRVLHSMCSPCHQNLHCLIRTCTKTNKPQKNLKISMMGRRPDSTLDRHNIVIGILTVGMMNKQIARHFQACESTISSLRSKICRWAMSKIDIMSIDHVRPPGERTLTM